MSFNPGRLLARFGQVLQSAGDCLAVIGNFAESWVERDVPVWLLVLLACCLWKGRFVAFAILLTAEIFLQDGLQGFVLRHSAPPTAAYASTGSHVAPN